jgi:hypothetical protein
MIQGQIILGLYTTLINLSPAAYRERTKQKNIEKIKKEAFKLSPLVLSVTVGRATSS